jgi:hypothetical protein
MTARVATPLLSLRVALERPNENPAGENVKVRLGPASDTPLESGPASDHKTVASPRGRMVTVRESTDKTSTFPSVIAMRRARACAAAI